MKVVLYGAPVVGFREHLVSLLNFDAEIVSAGYEDSREHVAAAFDGADAAITVRFDADIPRTSRLRLVQVPGVGCDEIDMASLPPSAALCNLHGHEQACAEYVIWALLQWRQRLCEAAASFRAGSWQRSSRFGAPPHGELTGSTVVIVGLGHIGLTIARRLRAFDVTVLGINRSLGEQFAELDEVDTLSGMTAAVRRADFVVLSLALTEETRGLVDAHVLAAMPNDAVLVNIARGPIVDEDSLHAALSSQQIGGAILDVWYRYPDTGDDIPTKPSRYDFAALPNVIMTPHVSGWTTGTVERRWQLIAQNIERLRDGRPLFNVVRPAVDIKA